MEIMNVAIFTRDAHRMAGTPAVVLLAAFPYDHRMWEGVARRFEGVPVIAIDPPGFGRSPVPLDPPSLEIYADYVAQAVRAEGAEKVLVCRNSMGGYTAQAMIERHPRLVGGVVLVGTKADIDTAAARAARTEMAVGALVGRAQEQLVKSIPTMLAKETLTDFPKIPQLMEKWINEAPGEAISWAQRALAARPGRLETLGRAQIPAMVVRGEQDQNSTPAQAEAMAKALGTRVVSVPRAGHLVPLEAPSAVARAVMSVYRRMS